jgi:hypothetical protein
MNPLNLVHSLVKEQPTQAEKLAGEPVDFSAQIVPSNTGESAEYQAAYLLKFDDGPSQTAFAVVLASSPTLRQ